MTSIIINKLLAKSTLRKPDEMEKTIHLKSIKLAWSYNVLCLYGLSMKATRCIDIMK